MGSLFSGIGGFELAASWVWGPELEIAFMCEIDPFCQKVLKHHWPDVPIVPDIKELHGEEYKPVDLITGGFPCQPFSFAGFRKGQEDDRFLWPEMLRVIKESRPTWIIGENVPGILNMGLETFLTDLETVGYRTQPIIVPACGIYAEHIRQRVFILAHSESVGHSRIRHCFDREKRGGRVPPIGSSNRQIFTGRQKDFTIRAREWPTPPEPIRVVDGIPNQLDRLKSLGNAIVPSVAAVLMQAIKQTEGQ